MKSYLLLLVVAVIAVAAPVSVSMADHCAVGAPTVLVVANGYVSQSAACPVQLSAVGRQSGGYQSAAAVTYAAPVVLAAPVLLQSHTSYSFSASRFRGQGARLSVSGHHHHRNDFRGQGRRFNRSNSQGRHHRRGR